MFKITYKSLIKSLLVVLLAFYGCSEETPVKKVGSTNKVVQENTVVKRILQAGFKKEDIVELKDRYVVDGDIAFYKKDPAPSKNLPTGRTQQARADFLVSPSYYNISVYLNTSSFSTIDLNSTLNDVISAYNALNTYIQLSRVYSLGEANIEIFADNSLDLGICGMAGFPFSDGRPFDKIYISEITLDTYGLTAPGQLTLLLAHELGHCIGFRHTNWQSQGEPAAIHINGTPSTDFGSFMNGSTCGNYWGGFSTYDALAMNILYSETTPPIEKEALYPNEQLLQNEYLRSSDGRFTLYMQGDGNLVIYYYNSPLWASNTCCDASIDRCVMQGDGNLVLYDIYNNGRWATNTEYYPGGFLLMQNDGNLVIYQNNVPVWASNTCCH